MPLTSNPADNAAGRWLALLLAAATLLGGCATHRLQPDPGKQPDYALPPAAAGPLHELAEQAARGADEDESSFLALSSNVEALKWRMLLTDLATQSIDIQYYLMDRDEGSKLLGRHLVRAADRGVQIRILVDDVFTGARDRNIVLWDRHPNISIRVFNPWHKRGSLVQQALEFLGYAERLNRRMHNKLFVVDGRVVISGGRNIGNPYFGLGSKYNFRDLEVVVTGPMVEQVADSFDLYWNDNWTVSADAFAAAGKPSETREEMYERRSRALDESEKLQQAGLLEELSATEYLQRFIDSAIHGEAWVVYDDPPSVVLEEQGVRKIEQLEELDADISREVLIVSPYFIPSEIFMEKLQGLTGRGVRVCVLTNSLASTNHTMVHSGYRPWRRKLLEAGVELYEYRSDATNTADILAPGVDSRFVALHTKTFILDREFVYIGSLNMDPRSFHLNTEIGLLIASPELAKDIAALVERDMSPENAWRVSLDDEGRLAWDSSRGTTRLQPARGLGQRIADFFYGLLPIKDQL